MPTEIIQLQGAGSGGTENAVATVDIPFDGSISLVAWAVSATFDAIGEFLYVELSFIATNQNNQNDARGIIDNVRSEFAGVTSGAGHHGINKVTPINDLRVQGGERLHMHIASVAGLVSNVQCLVHLETRGGSQRRAGRRRFA